MTKAKNKPKNSKSSLQRLEKSVRGWKEYGIELLITFIGVYAAFALTNWSDKRNDELRSLRQQEAMVNQIEAVRGSNAHCLSEFMDRRKTERTTGEHYLGFLNTSYLESIRKDKYFIFDDLRLCWVVDTYETEIAEMKENRGKIDNFSGFLLDISASQRGIYSFRTISDVKSLDESLEESLSVHKLMIDKRLKELGENPAVPFDETVPKTILAPPVTPQ
jgi:hypothetical protein